MALQDLTPQLRTRLRRVERIVGAFVTIASLLLLAGFAYYLYHTAVRRGWFVPKCPYYTFAMSAEGLHVGDPVVMMGFSVGKITMIEAQPPDSYYSVYVGFEILRPYYGYIWADSKLRITAADLFGRRQLVVVKGYAGYPTVKYDEGGRITEVLADRKTGTYKPVEGRVPSLYMEPTEDPTLAARAEKLVAQVEQALPSILGLTNQVQAVLTNAAQLTARLDHAVETTEPALSNLVVITDNLRDPHGSLGEWLLPTNLHAQTSLTLTNVNTQLVTLGSNLNQTLLNLAAITSNLNAQVESNDEILAAISKLVRDTDHLVQGLKKHWLLRGVFAKPNPKTPPIDPEASATNAPPNAGESPATNFAPR
ncbi:MCE family protein [bacterium]|nr:MCE family protein [bacterium]